VPVQITWKSGGQDVSITGSFNQWKHNLKLEASTFRRGEFHLDMELVPGKYKVKFLVDKKWKFSTDLPNEVGDDGQIVNVLEVIDLNLVNFEDPKFQVQSLPVHYRTNVLYESKLIEAESSTGWLPHKRDEDVLDLPDHVAVNHAYFAEKAESKEGDLLLENEPMVLGMTRKFSGKYVSVIYYRPRILNCTL
jgi:hypothetical protein